MLVLKPMYMQMLVHQLAVQMGVLVHQIGR
jgi:hypothetical protein